MQRRVLTAASALLALIATSAAGCSLGAGSPEDITLGLWRVETFNGKAVALRINTIERPTPTSFAPTTPSTRRSGSTPPAR